MGMVHNAKKGTVIEANGVMITVLRGSPVLDIAVLQQIVITIREKVTTRPAQAQSQQKKTGAGGRVPSGIRAGAAGGG